MKKTNGLGFTVVEVMVSMAIFAGTMGGFAGYYATTSRLRETGRNLSLATTHGRVVLEAIRDTAQQVGGLAAVTGNNWTGWAANAANGVVDPVTALPRLENEGVMVFYVATPPLLAPPPLVPGPAPAPIPDPLNVTVRVEWRERNRVRWTDVSTVITRR